MARRSFLFLPSNPLVVVSSTFLISIGKDSSGALSGGPPRKWGFLNDCFGLGEGVSAVGLQQEPGSDFAISPQSRRSFVCDCSELSLGHCFPWGFLPFVF